MNIEDLTPELIVNSGNFVVGSPRNVKISADGTRVAFLRADSPTGLQGLWINELCDGEWHTRRLDAESESSVSPLAQSAEVLLDRRREIAEGVVDYTTDDDLATIAYTDGAGVSWLINTATERFQPRKLGVGLDGLTLCPSGAHLAFLLDDGKLVIERTANDVTDRRVASALPKGADEFIGRPDFIAAEELDRFEGMWWSPDSSQLLFQYVDEREVERWTIAEPSEPATQTRSVRYPAAGGAVPLVGLRLVGLDGSAPLDIEWDREDFPYLVRVVWTEARLSFDVQSRDQRTLVTYVYCGGVLEKASTLTDDCWIEPTNGTIAHRPDGELCQLRDEDGMRALWLGADSPSPTLPGHILMVTGRCAAGLIVEVAVSRIDRRIALVRWGGSWEWLTADRGIGSANVGGGTVVVRQEDLDRDGPTTTVNRLAGSDAPPPTTLQSFAERCEWPERVDFCDLDDGGSTAAIVWPSWYEPKRSGPLPVIVDSYGGPLVNQVLRSRSQVLFGRWCAEQGYAVVSIDSIGAPGRGPGWERRLHKNLAGTADAHLAALDDVLAKYPDSLDRARVAFRGWSFGGYLAALIAIRRPDLCRAAVVGAPVSDWALYDAHYSERYLGASEDFRMVSEPHSVIHALDQIETGSSPAPMLILHGFSDDNVVAAHSIRLSEALSVKAIPHSCILLSSLRHVTRGDVFAKLRRIEFAFLEEHLTQGPL